MNSKTIFLLLIGIITITFCNAQTEDRIVINYDIQLVRLQDSVFLHITDM